MQAFFNTTAYFISLLVYYSTFQPKQKNYKPKIVKLTEKNTL